MLFFMLRFNVDKYKTKITNQLSWAIDSELESNLKVGDIFTVGEASGGDGEQAESSETGE